MHIIKTMRRNLKLTYYTHLSVFSCISQLFQKLAARNKYFRLFKFFWKTDHFNCD